MKIIEITSNYRARLMLTVYRNWITAGDSVLDIGCGTGVVAKILMNHLSIKITGCDIKNYLFLHIPFIKIKNNKLPIKSNSYNIAMLNDVLHHVDKQRQFEILKEAIRVAKKVLIFEAEPTFTAKLTDILLNKYHYGDLDTPLTFRSLNDWKDLFKKLSLESHSIKIKKPFWYPFSHIAFMVTKK